jgi:hypothetical protein
VLVNIALYDDDRKLVERDLAFYQGDDRGYRFCRAASAGSADAGREVKVVLNQVEEKKEKVAPKVAYRGRGDDQDHRWSFCEFEWWWMRLIRAAVAEGVGGDLRAVCVSVELEYWQVERV